MVDIEMSMCTVETLIMSTTGFMVKPSIHSRKPMQPTLLKGQSQKPGLQHLFIPMYFGGNGCG